MNYPFSVNLTQEEIDNPNKTKSRTLEVDLDIPEGVEDHEWHNDYPLAPEKQTVNVTVKLTPNLLHKRNYVVRHKTLKFYLDHGLKLVKIHRSIKYEESTFLKKCIDLNNDERKKRRMSLIKIFTSS